MAPRTVYNPPALRRRLLIALASGLAAWVITTLELRAGGAYLYALDFTTHWRAADAMIRGYSPYLVINAFSTLYPFGAGYLYMLPAAVLLMPFGYLSPQTAMPLFEGIAVAVFAFALMRDGYWRLPLLASAPLVYGALAGQTVPLVTAAMLMPSLGWLAPIKHSTGAAGAAYTMSPRYIAFAAGTVLVSIVIWPWWPAQWWAERHDIAEKYYHVPIFAVGGALVLLVVARWRRPEARLLASMACLPQTMLFYDQLPLVLIAQNYRQSLNVAAASWIAPAVAILHSGVGPMNRTRLFDANAPIILLCYYLPCLLVVLFRPNEGRVPTWLEHTAAQFPRWLRGRATSTGEPLKQIQDG
jgi:hypothetical protein